MAETVTGELYKRYRPRKLSEITGQKEALKILVDMGKRGVIPHAMLLSGPSGCGKTTIARIVARNLKCSDHDFNEINAASSRGIDMIRDIESMVGVSPMAGDCRVWLIDEAQSLTGDAQQAFLKLLEDMPPHVYFMLATTDPKKLKSTIITRCTQITCKSLTIDELSSLIRRVVTLESQRTETEIEVDAEVVAKVAETAGGSARQALVTLNAVIGLQGKEAQLAAIENADVAKEGIDLARLLYSDKATWSSVSKLLKTIEQDPEAIRRIIVGYGKTILLNSGSSRAHFIIEEFREPLFDVGTAGALLASSCYAIVSSK